MKSPIFLALAIFLQQLVVAATVTAIPDVTVIDGSTKAPIAHATIVLDGPTIREIRTGPNALKAKRGERVLHYENKFVLPGLINAHGHLGVVSGNSSGPNNFNKANIERQLKQYERYGVTTMMSLGVNKDLIYELRDLQRAGKLGGATLLTAGRGIGVPGGVPGLNVGPDQVYRPQTADEARKDVREMASHHPDMVKIWVDDNLGKSPKPNFDVVAAVINESHKQGLHVAAHVFYLTDAKRLVKEGVDVLAHSVRDAPVDGELVQAMKAHHTAYIPTLQLEEAFFVFADRPDWIKSPFFLNALDRETRDMLISSSFAAKIQADPATVRHRQFLQTAEQNLKTLAAAGVTIGFGTDSGAMPTRIAGFAEHRELALMVDAGLKPADAIRAATASNASILGIGQKVGTIEPGKQADLLIVDADPLADIANVDRIRTVIHKGVEVKLGATTSKAGKGRNSAAR